MVVIGALPRRKSDLLCNGALELLNYPRYCRGELRSPVIIRKDGQYHMDMIRHDNKFINFDIVIYYADFLNFPRNDFPDS